MINRDSCKNRVQIFLEYIFIILTIFQCNSMYAYESHDKIIINLLWQSLLVVLLFISYSNPNLHLKNNFKLVSFISIFTLIVSLFLVFELFYYPSFSKNYILILLIDPIILVIYFYNYSSTKFFNTLLYEFEDVMFVLSIVSLFFWAISNINILPHSSVTILEFFGKPTSIPSYFNIGFVGFGKYSMLGLNLFRNTGIFTEPSMYAYSLDIALFIGLFIRKESLSCKKMLVLIITILSVFSTTGVIFAILAIIYRLLISHDIKASYKLSLVIFIPLLMVFLRYVIVNKVNEGSSVNETSSYSIRSDDIKAGIEAWKHHIIVGNGLGNLKSVQYYIAPWRFLMNHTGISAGFTTILAFGGILFSLFYILPMILSSILSPFIRGLAVFSFLLIVFIFIQNRYECILIISYLWAYFISYNKTYVEYKNNE